MGVSSGTSNLLKLAGSWALAGVILAGGAWRFDELRAALGLKLEAEDFAVAAGETAGRSASQRAQATSARPSRGSFSVELRQGRDGHFATEAYINGRPVQVLVDTGATLVAMTHEDAQRAGIHVRESDYKYFSQTANGRARFAAVTLDDVRIGDVVVRNVQASVSEPGKLHVTLLGMAFLSRLKLDMQPGRLVLEQ